MTEKQGWIEYFPEKVVTAEQAVSCVRHGHRVFIDSGAGEPQVLVDALSNREDLSDTEIIYIFTPGFGHGSFPERKRENCLPGSN